MLAWALNGLLGRMGQKSNTSLSWVNTNVPSIQRPRPRTFGALPKRTEDQATIEHLGTECIRHSQGTCLRTGAVHPMVSLQQVSRQGARLNERELAGRWPTACRCRVQVC